MRGRKPKPDRPVKWALYVPTSTAAPFALITSDPVTGEQILGARSEIVSSLIEMFMNCYTGADPNEEFQRVLATTEKFIGKMS